MDRQHHETIDLYRVLDNREELLARTQNAYFSAWWTHFLRERDLELTEDAYPAIDQIEEMSSAAAEQARHSRLTAAAAQMHAMAFAHAMTGFDRYGERSRDLGLFICGEEVPWGAPVHRTIYPELTADLSFATLCIGLSESVGLIARTLIPEELNLLLDTLSDRAEVIETDALRGAWWGNAPNSNWTSHLMHALGSAGLALTPSRPDRARPWVTLASDRMGRMLDLAGEEGCGIEGIGYFMGCYASILLYGTKLRNVTGEDLFQYPFWLKCSRFPLYHTLPDLSGRTPVGDTHYPGLGGATLLCGVAREAADGVAQWQAHRVLERSPTDRISPQDLVLYDPSVPETPPDALPSCRVFHSVQVASFRSGWDRDAVYLHFHGGSNTWSHCHLDLNAFTLAAYGERLAVDHGSWGYSPHYFHVIEPQVSTAWHNTIVVDGADQRQGPRFRMSYDVAEGGDCYGTLSQHLSCQGIEMVRGDATPAYSDTLDRFWRDIVYLPPDRFIIYDSLRTSPARVQRHIQWLMHSEHPFELIEDRIEVCGDLAKLVVQPVFPQEWRCRFPDRLGRSNAHGDTALRETFCMSLYPQWVHIWNESPEHSPYPQWDPRGGERLYGPDYSFLVALTPLRLDSPIDWQVDAVAADGLEGAVITEGDRVDTVLFRRAGGPYALAGVVSDAEKVVVREVGGEVRSAAMVNGTHLLFRGERLVSEPEPTSRAIDL